MKKALLLKSALALALATPLLASAESQLVTGAGSATARLDFRVVVPRILFLAVGTGSGAFATNTTIDTVTFDYTGNPAAVGTGAAAAPHGAWCRCVCRQQRPEVTLAASTTGA